MNTSLHAVPPDGGTWPDYESTTITLKKPYDNSTGLQRNNIEFIWSVSSNLDERFPDYAYTCTLVISRNDDLSESVYSQVTTTNSHITNFDLEYGTQYYWGVIVKTAGANKRSDPFAFTTVSDDSTLQPPSAPTAKVSAITHNSFLVTASKGSSNTSDFAISVYLHDGTTPLVGYDQKSFSSLSKITVSGLSAHTSYDIRVWAYNDYNGGSYSSTYYSMTTTTLDVDYGDEFVLNCNEESTETEIDAVLLDNIVAQNGTVIASTGDVVRIYRDESGVVSQMYLFDNSNPNNWTQIYTDAIVLYQILPNEWRCRLLSNLWDEQDDGYGSEAQMCALYMALARLGEFSSASPDAMQAMSNRANQYLHALRMKYNSSKVNRVFTQVGF